MILYGLQITYLINSENHKIPEKFYNYIISKEELAPYLPERKPYEGGSGVSFRNLNVDRIYRLSAANAKWENQHFEFGEVKELLK